MAVNRTPQEHVETKGSLIDDTLTPTNHDGNAVDLKDTVDYLASQIADITGETAWETAPDASIATLVAKTFLDEKMANRWDQLLTDITVPNGQNYKTLVVASSEIPAIAKSLSAGQPGMIAAAHGGSFGAAHSLTEDAGKTTLLPENLLRVWDGDTGDALESSGRQVFGLLHSEAGATDGTVFTDTTPQRAQVSFVRANSTHDDLEAVPVADIEDKKINLAFQDRQYLDSWVAQDFLAGVQHIDLGIAGAATTLNNAYDNQGATPVTMTSNIFIRADDDTSWNLATSDGAVNMFKVAPAAAGDEVEINADTLDVNVGASGTIDFDNGMTIDSGGTAINLGVTVGQIDSTGALIVDSTANTLTLDGNSGVSIIGNAAEIDLTTTGAIDINGAGVTIDGTDTTSLIMTASDAGTKTLLVAARNGGAGTGDLELEADGDVLFETVRETTPLPLDDATAGAISGLFGQSFTSVSAAIKYAGTTAGDQLAMKLSVLGSSYAAGVNMPAVTLDLTAYTLDMGSNAATVFVYYNGRLLRGAAATGTGDVYPGTTPASGDLKHDFPAPLLTGGVMVSMGFA